MEFGYITFRSVTFAQQAERLLERSGLRCQLRRTPRWMEEQGCGYCLTLSPGALSRGAALLRRAGIAYRKVYIPDGGELREAVL